MLPGSEKFIPTMIHLSEIKLIGYLKSEEIVLSSSPPPYFTWTLNKLGLCIPDKALSLEAPKCMVRQIKAAAHCK